MDTGLIIFLLVLTGACVLLARAISGASMRRLQRGSGPETVADLRRKREEKAKRKAADDAEDEAAEAPATTKAGRKKQKKGKKGRKGQKGRAAAKAEAEEPEEPTPEPEPAKGPELLLPAGKSLGEGLVKTRSEGFVGRISKLFGGKKIDDSVLDQIEEVLFTADIGVKTSEKLLGGLRAKLKRQELSDEAKIWSHLKTEAIDILGAVEEGAALDLSGRTEPYVILVIGVNGAGKTTTIGKLAHRLVADGKKVLIGAGDTYRAAAVDQLAVWAKRVGAKIIEGEENADPSSVLFDAVKTAKAEGADAVLLDTAGRLHTNSNLVEELKKVRRVIGKAQDGAPHEVLLVLDATNGQNAIAQAHTFREALEVTAIALTKLDGTAKGGVILGICDELQIPIRWIGIGERTEDLRPFAREEFVDALFSGV